MARIFTTQFTYNHKVYDAIVTIINNNNKLNFTVRLLDEDLFEVLPDGMVKYQGKEGFRSLSFMNHHLAQNLLQNIASAIEAHTEPSV